MHTMEELKIRTKEYLEKAFKEGRIPYDFEDREITYMPGNSLNGELGGLRQFEDVTSLDIRLGDVKGNKFRRKVRTITK